jgi:hypothetical protein
MSSSKGRTEWVKSYICEKENYRFNYAPFRKEQITSVPETISQF